ncbi:hypothetical protein PAXINDRAFT_53964, partial [Paxillus involutus ATCC 200175]
WTSWFLSSKDKEYFCEVEEGYILYGFNLTGPNNEQDVIIDNLDDDIPDGLRSAIDVRTCLLYGLIHTRWIASS